MRTFKILFVVLLILMVTTSCYNSDYEYTSDTISTAKLQETLSNIKNENSNSNEELVIRFITIGKENAWRSVNHNDIINSAEKFDVDFELLDAGSTEQEIYIDMLKKSVEQDIDIIGFTPVIETGWDEILEKAKEAEIPVIILDRIVNCTDESLWMSRIVNDFYKEGQMAGEWLIDYLERQEKSDEEIKIVEIRGTDNAEAATDRGQGFREAIKGKENLKITISKEGHFIQDIGYEEMSNILSETTDIDVLFCHNDEMAIGAIQAIEEAGLVPGEDIIIISIEGTNAALEAIVDGKIACSVECNPLMGDLFMEACVRLANGEEIEREIHPVDRVFDITNAQAELDARKENGYGY